MKLVLASKNQKKLVEMNEILSHLGIQVCSEAEAGVDVEVEETGTTFEENSLLKARAVMEASGMPAIADDSGLCVDALNGAPGVYSARYGGEGLDDTGRYRLLLENMRGQTPRTAKFVSVITCCFPNRDVLTARRFQLKSAWWWAISSASRGNLSAETSPMCWRSTSWMC